MVRRYIMTFSALLAGLFSQGCFNSQSDYDLLVTDRDTLAEELAAANRENEILNQALDNIKKEQERLQILLNTARSQQAPAVVSNNTQQPAPPLSPLAGDTPTMSWGGYDWNLPSDTLANSNQPNTGPAAGAAPTSPPPASGEKIYRPRSGDVLSSIAARHNTTVERLVELNPYLARRNNYMIHLTDKIVLP